MFAAMGWLLRAAWSLLRTLRSTPYRAQEKRRLAETRAKGWGRAPDAARPSPEGPGIVRPGVPPAQPRNRRVPRAG